MWKKMPVSVISRLKFQLLNSKCYFVAFLLRWNNLSKFSWYSVTVFVLLVLNQHSVEITLYLQVLLWYTIVSRVRECVNKLGFLRKLQSPLEMSTDNETCFELHICFKINAAYWELQSLKWLRARNQNKD